MQFGSFRDEPRYQYYLATRGQQQAKTRDIQQGQQEDPRVKELFSQDIAHAVPCFKSGFMSAGRQRADVNKGLIGRGDSAAILESKFLLDSQDTSHRPQGLGYGVGHRDHFEYRSQEMPPRFIEHEAPEPIARDLDAMKSYKSSIAPAIGYGDKHHHHSHYLFELPELEP